MVWCGVVWCSVVWYGMVWYCKEENAEWKTSDAEDDEASQTVGAAVDVLTKFYKDYHHTTHAGYHAIPDHAIPDHTIPHQTNQTYPPNHAKPYHTTPNQLNQPTKPPNHTKPH